MKKAFLLLLLLLPSLSFGANVTQAQVKQAKQASNDLIVAAQKLLLFTNYINGLFDSNFQMPIYGSTTTVTMSNAAKTELIDVNKYLALKQAVVDAYNQLP